MAQFYGELNNNNNANFLGFYNDVSAAAFPHMNCMTSHLRGSTGRTNNFTFASPTQYNVQNMQRQSSPRGAGFSSPGTTWQHSIPVNMPWVNACQASSVTSMDPSCSLSSRTSSPLSTSLITDDSNDMEFYCSGQKASKRKSQDTHEEAPHSKVYLCTNQFANLHISPSTTFIPEDLRLSKHTFYYPDAGQSNDPNGWERFKTVENRLESDTKEEKKTSGQRSDERSDGPVLQVEDGVLVNSAHNLILPNQIIQEIKKPCMQLIVWQSPSENIRETFSSPSESSTLPLSSNGYNPRQDLGTNEYQSLTSNSIDALPDQFGTVPPMSDSRLYGLVDPACLTLPEDEMEEDFL